MGFIFKYIMKWTFQTGTLFPVIISLWAKRYVQIIFSEYEGQKFGPWKKITHYCLLGNLHIELPFFSLEKKKKKENLLVSLFFAKNILVRNCCLCVGVKKKMESFCSHVAFLSCSSSLFLFLISFPMHWVELMATEF